MLTVIICAVVFLCLFKLWEDEVGYLALELLVVVVIALFAVLFPLIYGDYMTDSGNIIETYEVSEVNDLYYYLDDGRLTDVTTIDHLTQADELKVVERRAKSSIWYWSISRTECYLPIVKQK